MKRVELLIPVGDKESLINAVNFGADALYFAGINYGARKYAENFQENALIEAIKYAHLYGVKVYITVNTLIHQTEVNAFYKYIELLYVSGVDAVIVQDIGMIELIHRNFPQLEIHASTQVHITNENTLNYLESLGVKRCVFARELSLEEIKNMNTSMEKEVFIHGALCVCYSGECLFSSLVGGRSGNRGECVGSCRLPYELYENDKKIYTEGKYLLSTKELCSTNNIKEILDSNIDSLKIEGRMKSPLYVAYITKIYRSLIDKYYSGEEVKVSTEDINKLKTIFNREFTKGYLFNEKDISNIKHPNHIGFCIGVVEEVKNKIKIRLTEDLNQHDGIRIDNNDGMIVNFLYDKNMKLTSHVKKGDICYLDNKIKAHVKDCVYKTSDSLLDDEIKNAPKRKIGVNLKVKAIVNELLEVSYDNVTLKGNIVQPSIKRPTTKSEIIRSLSKLGDTPFVIENANVDSDENIFISVSELNNLRRMCVDILLREKTNVYRESVQKKGRPSSLDIKVTNDVSVLVRNERQLKKVLSYDVSCVYVTNYDLYKKYKSDKRVFYRTCRVPKVLEDFNNENLLISELGAFNKYSLSNYVVTDAYLNVTNSYSLYQLHKNGSKKVTLSLELDMENIRRIIRDYKEICKSELNVEVIVYARPELMISKYNLFKKFNLKNEDDNKYYLVDRMNEKYRILSENDLMYVMHYKNIDLTGMIGELKDYGVTNFRIELLDESDEEIDSILYKVIKSI